MSYARAARLPFDHLLAELAAFPLASETALHNPVTHLDPGMSGGTGELWRAAERELIASAPGVSLDELVAMRDLCWFNGSDAARSLAAHLRATTSGLLRASGAGLAPHRAVRLGGPFTTTPGHAHSRRAWRWLTLALPEDLLLAAGAAQGCQPESDLLSPAVRDLLQRGFAETHLHVGASLDFATLWALTMARLANPSSPLRDLAAPGAALAEGTQLGAWLVRAALGRVLLAGFLASGEPGPFLAYLHGPACRTVVLRRAGSTTFTLMVSALRDLVTGRLSGADPRSDEAGMRAALAVLAPVPAPDLAGDLATVGALDPVGGLVPLGVGGTAEQRYVSAMCGHLDRSAAAGRPDEFAAQLFWQTVRVRNLLYRYVTQRPLTPGLAWFIRFYARMSSARGSTDPRLLVETAQVTSGRAEGLRSLEMRTSPEPEVEEMRTWVTAIAERSSTAGAPAMAMVFHFVKSRGGGAEEGLPKAGGVGTRADPEANTTYRFGRFFTKQQESAISLATVLHRWPRTQFVIRGLDLCADELAIPTWVFRPLMRYVRAAARSGGRCLRSRGEAAAPPLRTTVHAGEDFAHLLTGLRHIHEAVDLLDLREGDRIGHGFALGVDPARWAAQAGRVAMPLEDRVLDLAWEWGWWTSRGHGMDAARLAYLERSIAELTQRWLGSARSALDIERLRADLADDDQMELTGFPHHHPPAQRDGRLSLLLAYLCDPQVFRAGRATEWVDPTNEVDAITRISTALRLEVTQRCLAIEINPTSNLLIGDLGDLEHHPLWRLHPPRPRADLPPLAITVGSDDPLVFNCRLPGEYQLLFDTLLMSGLTDSEAMAWLESVRRTGLERRFTDAGPPPGDLFGLVNAETLEPPAR